MNLAELVREMVTDDGARFPFLSETLRNDVTLNCPPTDVWSVTPGPVTAWGRLADVAWVREVAVLRSPRSRLGDVRMSESHFGRAVELTVRGDSAVAVRVELELDAPIEIHDALVAMLRGAADSGTTGIEVGDASVPIDPLVLAAEYTKDVAELTQRVDDYRRGRCAIDALLETAVAAR